MAKELWKDWSKLAVLVAAVGFYLVTFMVDPTKAKESAVYGLKEMRKLLVPLLAAVFVGATVKNLITPGLISKIFGGNKSVLTAGTIGSILPPCPFISYPAIKGFDDGGIGLPSTMTMLIATTVVETGQLFCGLAVFGPEIIVLRISFAFLAAMIVGFIFFFIYSR